TALADELEEAATRMVVLGEATEMVGQAPNPLGQERDLDLRRPGVTFLGGIPGHDLLLLFPRERHSFLRTRTSIVTCSFYDRRRVAGSVGSGKRRCGSPRRRGALIPTLDQIRTNELDRIA